jgi:hypothetical protein
VRTLEVPLSSLLIFCSIGFALLLAIPGIVIPLRKIKEPSKLLAFFKISGKFFILPAMGYIIGAFIGLLYFSFEDFKIYIWSLDLCSYWIIVFTTALVLSLIPVFVLGLLIKEFIEKTVERTLREHKNKVE